MDKIIRKKELLNSLGVSDATLWRWEQAGAFPKRIQLGGNSVGWPESEIQAWQDRKKAEREPMQAVG
jgi:prophage regulatory protein